MLSALKDRAAFHILIIVLLGLAVYWNAFDVPFQWDDEAIIVNNPIVKDLGNFADPSKAAGYPEYGLFMRRYVSFLSFALNYKFGGLSVGGYHAFNVSVHILNALLVYALVALTLRTPLFIPPNAPLVKGGIEGGYLAFFVGLVFVSHPVQTEAVTYITQRFASLMALFYLLSVAFYIKYRLLRESEISKLKSVLFYVLSLICALLAMKTKENSLTLPFSLALYEFVFFRGASKWPRPLRNRRYLPLVPFFALLAVFPLSLAGTGISPLRVLFGIGPEDAHTGSVFEKDYLVPGYPRWGYFITQFRVVVSYLRLLFYPANQRLDYEHILFDSILEREVLFSLVFLLIILGAGIYALRTSRSRAPQYAPVAFGIFWFFLTLSVESGLSPLPTMMAEYRIYLPGIGIILAVLSLGFIFAGRIPKTARTAFFALLVFSISAFSWATHERNNVWRSEISLWEDVARKSPQNPRGHYKLALLYYENGSFDEAIKQYGLAMMLGFNSGEAHYNLAVVYMKKGSLDEAIGHFRTALGMNYETADVHYGLGMCYDRKGLAEKARSELAAALRINPNHYKARRALGATGSFLKQL